MPDSPEHGGAAKDIPEDEILPEYGLQGGVRGRYANRHRREAVLVPLDPDVAEVFPDAEAVNRALRVLAEIIKEHQAQQPME